MAEEEHKRPDLAPREQALELFRDPAETVRDERPVPGASRSPRRIVVSGAKGGVGKTTFTANLGLYLASLGRRVLLVDADAEGANLHGMLGLDPGATGRDVTEGPVSTSVPGLSIWAAGLDEAPPSERRRRTRTHVLRRLNEFEFDHVLVDVGSGSVRSLTTFWLSADLSIYLTTPEPGAIENTYRFVRASFARHLLASVSDPALRARVRARVAAFGPAPGPNDVVRRLDAAGDPLADVVREALATYSLRFLMNQIRLRSDAELGPSMRSAARQRLGIRLEFVGHIDWDDAAWTASRSGRLLLLNSPGARASRAIERVGRRLLGPEAGLRGVTLSAPEGSHHELLELGRGASDEEIRRASRRAREIFAPGALPCQGLYDGEGLRAMRARIDEATDVLLDPVRRLAYESSVFPPVAGEAPRSRVSEAPLPVRAPPPVLDGETEITGALLRAVREARGTQLDDVSRQTKVRVGYLQAIETDDFERLPEPVYVRGFVQQLAKALGLDAVHVSRGYTQRYERFLEEKERGR